MTTVRSPASAQPSTDDVTTSRPTGPVASGASDRGARPHSGLRTRFGRHAPGGAVESAKAPTREAPPRPRPGDLIRATGGSRYAVALGVDALGTGILRPFLLLYGIKV